MYRIGVDVGGTFTDFAMLDEDTFEVSYHKVPSTPDDPARAIRDGTAEFLRSLDLAPSEVSFMGHGTTVATNMIIERRGVRTGLLTTRGFRDILELGRQTRPDLYDYSVAKPAPLVPRERRIEIAERVGADGQIVTPIDERELEEGVRQLKASGVEAVAICFLHSYRNDRHEQAARAAVKRHFPESYISVSSEILPEFREYERLSTTVLNAYTGPKMQAYLDALADGVRKIGVRAEPYTVHSNGGLMSIPMARRFPVRTCLSGPAAGVVGAAVVSTAAHFPSVITFDVGGTSTDVSLIKEGKPLFASSRRVADYPIKTPMVNIHVIGAGGGSIAWIDDAGALKVGPHSAGADPGPVAYGKGGDKLTITDVNICLQRLNPVALLRGRLAVNAERARDAVMKQIAAPLGLDLETAAHGVLRIANANMSRAIRSVSTERGYDLSEFALFAYGGAGPLHACEVAEECGIPVVIVPQEPGTMCARGILLSDVSFDFVRTEIAPASADTWQRICGFFAGMMSEGHAWLEQENVAARNRLFQRKIEARYVGQNYEISVAMDDIAADGLPVFMERFRDAHAKEYGYEIPGRDVEIVNCRLQAIGQVPRAPLNRVHGKQGATSTGATRRTVYCGKDYGWISTKVYARESLPVEVELPGPAIIEEMSSTTVVLPHHRFHVDRIGNIIIEVKRARTR